MNYLISTVGYSTLTRIGERALVVADACETSCKFDYVRNSIWRSARISRALVTCPINLSWIHCCEQLCHFPGIRYASTNCGEIDRAYGRKGATFLIKWRNTSAKRFTVTITITIRIRVPGCRKGAKVTRKVSLIEPYR